MIDGSPALSVAVKLADAPGAIVSVVGVSESHGTSLDGPWSYPGSTSEVEIGPMPTWAPPTVKKPTAPALR